MKGVRLAALVALPIALAAPAHADDDTDFVNMIHGYGIYGPNDYNTYLAKITCNRLGKRLDTDAYESADFLSKNLPRTTSVAQRWQFLGSAITIYCPDLRTVLEQVAAQHN